MDLKCGSLPHAASSLRPNDADVNRAALRCTKDGQ